jgi:tRNA 2-thiouridine synthesizing protein A
MTGAKFPSTREELIVNSTLDIRNETCPMTFVRVRLALDRMSPGSVLEVLLRGDEPRRNVPRTAEEQGHTILAMTDEAGEFTRLLLRRAEQA